MDIKQTLISMSDEKTKDFIAKLTPNIEKESILGIKVPKIREFEKTISQENKLKFIKDLPHKYYEENILHGAILSNLKIDFNEQIKYLEDFLPYVDNWAVCDLINMKSMKKNPVCTYEHIKEWIKSDKEYTVRFGIVALLQFFLDDNFEEEHLYLIASIKREEYYINMAIAWYYSFALIKQYESTIKLFEQKILDKWIHNKSIQKARESYRISAERKEYLKSLKV